MTDVAFYHLQRSSLDVALPRLLEKTLQAGKRAVVITGSDARAEALATALWTYDQASWLPHGTAQDGHAEDQPIWLTSRDDNPNGAQFLFLADGADSVRVGEYERCFDLFDGNDESAVAAARARWAARRDEGHSVTYWQQTDGGGWDQKAYTNAR